MSISLTPTLSPADSVKSGSAVSTTKATPEESQKSDRAKDAIEKFEGLFMSMMIKQLRETGTGEGFFPGDASDTYGGMFDMFMGDHLAKSTDIGIDRLFSSSAAMRQLEEHVTPKLILGQQSKGIEEYRNEQLRSGTINAPPSA